MKNEKRIHLLVNIWGADRAEMQLISKFKKGIQFLLCVSDVLTQIGYSFKRQKYIYIYIYIYIITNAFC